MTDEQVMEFRRQYEACKEAGAKSDLARGVAYTFGLSFEYVMHVATYHVRSSAAKPNDPSIGR